MTDRFMSAADFRAAMALLHERGISANELHKIFECGTTSRAAGPALARPAMWRWPWPRSCGAFPPGRQTRCSAIFLLNESRTRGLGLSNRF